MHSNKDESEYFAEDKGDNIGKTEIQYIKLVFNQNLLTEIEVLVTGKEDGLSLKESLTAAFGEPFENRSYNNHETITWHGKITKLVYRGMGENCVAIYTNDDVNSKVEDIIKQKAKDNSKEGSKSL